MNTLMVSLASVSGVVLAGVVAHGAWQAWRAGPKQASADARGRPGKEPTLDAEESAVAAAVSSRGTDFSCSSSP